MMVKVFLTTLVMISFGLAETNVDVEFKLTPMGKFHAKTKEVNGTAFLNGDEIKAEKISVDLNSLTTDMNLRDDHMKNKYLEVSKYPTAELLIGKGKEGKGEGKIKIRGVEKDITGTYSLINNNKELEAKFEINLTDFNIKGIRYLSAGVKDIASVTVVVPVRMTDSPVVSESKSPVSPSNPSKESMDSKLKTPVKKK